jgi:hypothetical protein
VAGKAYATLTQIDGLRRIAHGELTLFSALLAHHDVKLHGQTVEEAPLFALDLARHP